MKNVVLKNKKSIIIIISVYIIIPIYKLFRKRGSSFSRYFYTNIRLDTMHVAEYTLFANFNCYELS